MRGQGKSERRKRRPRSRRGRAVRIGPRVRGAFLSALDAVGQPLVEAVLDAAGDNAMRVFVGLALPESANGDPQAARDEALMAAIIDQSKESAVRLADRFGSAPAFAGFYLPLEAWTPGARGELGRPTTASCHRPVIDGATWSPAIPGGRRRG